MNKNLDYEEIDKQMKVIRERNKDILSSFEKWLIKKELSRKVINTHVTNVAHYINDYLLYSDAIEAKDGSHEIENYLGYWSIKKGLCSSTGLIKESAASLKKFYQFMYEAGEVSDGDLADLKTEIKEGMPEWLETVERYYDDDIDDMETVWGI